jgi:phenylalanyl-tRNA synthetase beta chain
MAMKRALHLIEELNCGKVSSTHVDTNTGNSIESSELKVSVNKVNAVLGITVPDEDIMRILTGLNFEPSLNGDELTLKVPAYREDMESYQDVAEEIIRMYGYDHIKGTFMPTAQVTLGGYNLEQKTQLKIKRALCSAGASEGVHYSFFSPASLDMIGLPDDAPERKAIKIMNPINEDLSLMRTTLAPQMIQAMQRNQKKGILEGRIFEVGNIFVPKSLPLSEYPDELETVCIGCFGADEDFFTAKGLVDVIARTLNISFDYEACDKTFLHPYRTAKILCDGEEVGYVGQVKYEIIDELDMRVDSFVAEVSLYKLVKYYGKEQTFVPLSKFPEEKRDLCFVMNKNVTCAQIEKAIYGSCEYVTDVELFDVYEGMQLGLDKKSMTFSVIYTPKDEELKADRIDGFVADLLGDLKEKYDVVLRS